MIRRLCMNDAAAYVALRRESLASAPLAFASSPEEDFALDPATLETYLDGSADEVILGAFADALVGAVGLFRDRHRKAAHKAHLWGMYVQPAHRGAGLGGKLLADAVKHARGLPGVSSLHLSVTTDAPGAQRLYEAAGFRAWGTQPDSLRHDDRSVAEIHMALSLSAPAPAT